MVFSSMFSKSAASKKKKAKETSNPQSNNPTSSHRRKKRRLDHHPTDRHSNNEEPHGSRKGTTTQLKTTNHYKTDKQKGPSPDALRLSERLRTLSRNKDLSGALEVYRDKSNDSIRDGHHACIVVDCCARCGSILEGEKIIEEMKKAGSHINVETCTALLKGYSLAGMIDKADDLFKSMCNAKAKRDLPNTRSLNTLLRGCLWSAARPDGNGAMVGGVVTAERAWNLCKELQDQGRVNAIFDVSSYEYSISLLCQALRTSDAIARIDDMKCLFLGDDVKNADQGVTETLAISYLALARAYSILNESGEVTNACNQSMEFIDLSLKALAKGASSANGKSGARHDTIDEGRRAESNAIFRKHRLREVQREALALTQMSKESDAILDPRQIARRLLTRLIVLSGGGTTSEPSLDKNITSDATQQANENPNNLHTQIVNTAYFSYGFDGLVKKLNIPMRDGVNLLKKRDCNRLLGAIGLQGGVVQADGAIDFQRIFSAGIGQAKQKKSRGSRRKSRRMEIELGAGFGDWIVKKAIENPSSDFLSVELRADRVGQTFARTAALASVSPVDNLCIVGAESCSFLLHHVKEASVSTIYVNHPEPPTQTSGLDAQSLNTIMDGGVEPSHMLNSRMIIAAGKCLSGNGDSRIVVVTDNRWYGRLICATLVKVCNSSKGLLVPVDLAKEDDTFELAETFPEQHRGRSDKTDSGVSVGMYQGQPNESIGHSKNNTNSNESIGESYFDRLWRSGGGTHAEKHTRFIMVLSRP